MNSWIVSTFDIYIYIYMCVCSSEKVTNIFYIVSLCKFSYPYLPYTQLPHHLCWAYAMELPEVRRVTGLMLVGGDMGIKTIHIWIYQFNNVHVIYMCVFTYMYIHMHVYMHIYIEREVFIYNYIYIHQQHDKSVCATLLNCFQIS